jgi:outer membrane receptor protein involved in Fe transport
MTYGTVRSFAAACLVTTAMVGVVQPAFAQIEEIIVTTRKRAETLQEVPIVVTAFTAESLDRKGIANVADILKYTPGVQINEGFSPQDQRIVIRGLSPTRGRPNVAVLQDDIDISSESLQSAGGSLLINPRLFDLERVEIIKGPHSALYGRSAFAGALNYITKKPGQDTEGRASIDVGTYGKVEAKVSASGPAIDDVLSVGVNASYWHFDGFHTNSVTNEKIGGNEGMGVAGSAVYRGSDTFKATFRMEYTDDEIGPPARAVISPNLQEAVPATARTDVPVAVGGTAGRGFVVSPILTTFPIVNGAIPDVSDAALIARISPNPRTGEDYPGTDRKIFRTTLRLDEEFEFADFISLTHYGRGHTLQFLELANVGNVNNAKVAQEVNFDTVTKLVSQEVRLQSNDEESPFRWTVGGLYWNEEANQLSRSVTCFTTFPTRVQVAPGVVITSPAGNPAANCGPFVAAVGTTLPSNPENWGRNTYHSSLYALIDFDITDELSFTGEIRQTWEREHTKGPTFTHGIDPYGIISTGVVPAGCPMLANPTTATPVNCLTRDAGVLVNGVRVGDSTATIGGIKSNSFYVPRAGFNYKVSSDLLFYASAAKGVKPGGVSTLGGGNGGYDLANLSYDAEEMWVYEGGFKSTFADGKALFNAALYYQDFSDKQASTQIVLPNGTLGTRIVNAAAARVKGVDLETAFAPTSELSFNLGYTYNDAKYKDFIVRTSGANPIVRSQSCIPVVTYTANGVATTVVNPTSLPAGATITGRSCDVDKSGHKLEFAPTHSLQFSTSYRADIGNDYEWVTELSIQAQSKRYTDDDERSYLQGFWNADFTTGIEGEQWTVTAYVNNVLDDDTIKGGVGNTDFPNLSAIASPAPFTLVLPSNFTANLPDKRQFGVRAAYKF